MNTGIPQKKVNKLNRRNVPEIDLVHPVTYALIRTTTKENGEFLFSPDNIHYEYPLTDGCGRADFVCTDVDGKLHIFECKNRIYNKMELGKAAVQVFVYKEKLNADYVYLIVPEDNLYPDAYEDVKKLVQSSDIQIIEVPILDRIPVKKKVAIRKPEVIVDTSSIKLVLDEMENQE